MTNVVVLQGRLSRPVSERELPSGDRLATLELTVAAITEAGPRPGAGGSASRADRAESVPLAWFGAPGWVLDLDTGAELVVVGRVRRRFFRAGERLQSRTEVVVDSAAPVRRMARVGELVDRAVRAIGEVVPPAPARRRAPATFP